MGCGEGGWRQREWEEETGRGSGLGDQGTGFKVLGKAKGMFGSRICRPKTIRLANRTMLVGCELCLYVI
jgi:hypothetical protein